MKKKFLIYFGFSIKKSIQTTSYIFSLEIIVIFLSSCGEGCKDSGSFVAVFIATS